MRFQVWHAKNPSFGIGAKPAFPESYTKIAEVECDALDDVFEATNHIDRNWLHNPEVKASYVLRARSTSVGDVVVTPEGKKMYCASVGWEELP